MNRFSFLAAFAFLALLLNTPAAHAQTSLGSAHSTSPAGRIDGRVLDEKRAPVAGALVSVVGRAIAVATTDSDGRYSLKNLPFGPYVLSVRTRGYRQSPGRTVQLTASKISEPEIQLTRVSSEKAPVSVVAASSVTIDEPVQLAAFGAPALPVALPAPAPAPSGDRPTDDGAGEAGETAWRLRHLPRSILKDAGAEAAWVPEPEFEPRASWFGRDAIGVRLLTWFNNPALTGQVKLLTTESFDSPGNLLGPNSARSIAFVSVGTQAAGGAWAMQGAMTQGDLASWIVAGSYTSIDAASHAYDMGLSYSTQRYDGGNAVALAAVRDSTRNVGTVHGHDLWTVSPRLVLGYGSGYAKYDYLAGSGLWSPQLSVTIRRDGLRLKAIVSSRAMAPGAEELAPSVDGLWLPQERTFSSLAMNGVFSPERTRHMEMSLERDLVGGVNVSVRGFGQRVNDQLIEMFGVDMPGRPETPLGHYFVGTAGDVDVRGWGVGLRQEAPGHLRSTIEYTVATASWLHAADASMLSRGARSAALASSERVYDLQTSVEALIPQTATKIYAKYRMNTAFWRAEADRLAQPNSARFNVRVNQSLPFLRFYNADYEMLVDVRNMFRDADPLSSLYDEALAVRAPKRIVGGLLVKF